MYSSYIAVKWILSAQSYRFKSREDGASSLDGAGSWFQVCFGMPNNYVPPEPAKGAFTCPHCNVHTQQRTYEVSAYASGWGNLQNILLHLSECTFCNGQTVWHDSTLIYPIVHTAPMPHIDMPEDVKAEYLEARSIVTNSPKGATALLRLAVQKLCVHLGEPGRDINRDIGSLVQKGLAPTVQKAFDAMRIVGNEAVHPGQINFNDTPEIANAMFGLLNFIVEDRITRPREIDQLYNSVPEDKRKWVEDRDKKSKP